LEPEQQEKIAGIIIESLEEIGVPCFAVTP
jgi:hypothetical protein